MPWASQAQRAKFYADPRLHKYIAEFNAATPKGKKLPKRVKGNPALAAEARRRVKGVMPSEG